MTVADCTNLIPLDSDEETYSDEEMVTILSFLNECTSQELGAVPGLSAKKAEKIMNLRPFDSWDNLVSGELHFLFLFYVHFAIIIIIIKLKVHPKINIALLKWMCID